MARTALILIRIVTLAALVGCATRPAPAPFVTGDAIGQGSGQDGNHCTWTSVAVGTPSTATSCVEPCA